MIFQLLLEIFSERKSSLYCVRDSDSDGIVDSFDQCPNTVLGTVVDQTGCDFDNSNGGSSSGGLSNGNSSSLPEDQGLPGFEASLAIAAVCVAFMIGTRNKESEI